MHQQKQLSSPVIPLTHFVYVHTVYFMYVCTYIQLNDDYYECLTPESTIALLEACKAGNPPKMGKWGSLPMNGQVSLCIVYSV